MIKTIKIRANSRNGSICYTLVRSITVAEQGIINKLLLENILLSEDNQALTTKIQQALNNIKTLEISLHEESRVEDTFTL